MLATIAKLTIKDGSQADFEAVAKELVAAVNKNEPGCKLYQLHKGDEPTVYWFIERYENQEAVEAHRAAPHFKELGRKMGDYMDGKPEITRLTQISEGA